MKERALIERDFSFSAMSDTKWERLIANIAAIPMFPAFRVKTIDGPEPSDAWEGSWPWHIPSPFGCIEWLELSPEIRKPRGQLLEDEIVDKSPDLEQAIRDANAPFSREGSAFRIWGHVRRDTSPEFQK